VQNLFPRAYFEYTLPDESDSMTRKIPNLLVQDKYLAYCIHGMTPAQLCASAFPATNHFPFTYQFRILAVRTGNSAGVCANGGDGMCVASQLIWRKFGRGVKANGKEKIHKLIKTYVIQTLVIPKV
jgi:hypothetical protein